MHRLHDECNWKTFFYDNKHDLRDVIDAIVMKHIEQKDIVKYLKKGEANGISFTYNRGGNVWELKHKTSPYIGQEFFPSDLTDFDCRGELIEHPNKYKEKPGLPKYRKRGSEFNMYYTNQNCRIRNGKIILSKELSIDIPQYEKYSYLLENFKQIRILPNHIGYRIEVIYEVEDVEIPKRKEEKIASIDLGIDNLATIVSEDFTIIFSGKFVKSHNQLFNKTLAKLNSIKDLQKIKGTTRRIKKLYYDREQYIEDVFHKISRKIVNLLIDSKITKLIVGYNKGWKQNVDIGKKNNQKFTQIPFARLVSYLEYKCELAGIEIVIHEESYTSKCDSLAFEKIGKHENYLGKRKNRGLFQSSVGKLINADVNGALNIMRKVVGDSCESIQRIIDRGLLFNPVRITNVFC